MATEYSQMNQQERSAYGLQVSTARLERSGIAPVQLAALVDSAKQDARDAAASNTAPSAPGGFTIQRKLNGEWTSCSEAAPRARDLQERGAALAAELNQPIRVARTGAARAVFAWNC